ncbi:MAG: YicC/YloC family endoribonuclease [Pseudomonadota bacterium]
MINSMTAFARAEAQGDWGAMSWELKSVNHRYLDVTVRLPEELRLLEPAVRERLAERLQRGKVECQLRFQVGEAALARFTVNEKLAKELSHASRLVDSLLYNPSPVNSLDLLRWPGVLTVQAPDPELLQRQAMALLDQALKDLSAARAREGARLQELVVQRCQAMQEITRAIRARLPQVQAQFRAKLEEKLAELKIQFDEGRLEQEVVLLVNKSAIDEELDRLETHLIEVNRIFQQGGACGRRLDFLMQEFNRESNTIASKSADKEITRHALDLKVLIEQAREQIQNVE